MIRQSSFIGIVATASGLLINASTAQAAAATWVSATGSDTGTCPITAPCRTFSFAHSQTNNNGSINVLTSGNFGPLTIAKAISIVADGVEAVINTGAGGAGIIVQAGAAAVVSLRGLIIDMRGTANHGIFFFSGAALHVHNSVIRKAGEGIFLQPASGNLELYVADTTVANSAGTGIEIRPNGNANVNVVLDRVRVENSLGNGMAFFGNSTTGIVTATVRDSISAGNGNHGIITAENAGGGTTTAMLERTASLNNDEMGVIASGAGATIRIGNSTVSGNQVGMASFGGGVIQSYGTNKVNGNGTDGDPSSTIASK